MGYGELRRFANYNEQAIHYSLFAPVPTWIYPPLAKLWRYLTGTRSPTSFVSPHNAIFNSNGWELKQLQTKWGDRVQVFKANLCPFLPEQVLAEIKAQGFDKLLIYPSGCRFHLYYGTLQSQQL